jgi:hypothetical protein
MLRDANLMVSGTYAAGVAAGQVVTGAGVTVVSTNSIDLLQSRDVAEGREVFANMEVTVAFVGATSVEMQVVTSAVTGLTTPTVIGTTGAIPVAQLTLGAKFSAPLGSKPGVGQRHLGVQYVIVGTGTAGAVIADFGMTPHSSGKNYPVGSKIV